MTKMVELYQRKKEQLDRSKVIQDPKIQLPQICELQS